MKTNSRRDPHRYDVSAHHSKQHVLSMNANLEFEITAEAFRWMTGMMAPGKDVPAVTDHTPIEARQVAWFKWNNDHHKIIRAMLHAADAHLCQE